MMKVRNFDQKKKFTCIFQSSDFSHLKVFFFLLEKKMSADSIASPNLPHFAGLNWRLDVPRASRASVASGNTSIPEPVYSLRLSLAHIEPGCFDKNSSSSSSQSESKSEEQQQQSTSSARVEDVAFSCTPETLIALAEAVEAAVNQSEQAPYRRILRLIR
jgi:hypothetical protein